MKHKYYIEEYITGVLMGVMLVVLFANIIGRIFGASISFSQELVVYLFVVCSMLGAASACARGANMGLTILTDHLPKKARIVFAVLDCVAAIILFAILFKQGLATAISMAGFRQRTPIMHIPTWIFELSYPVGSAFYIFREVTTTIKDIKKIKEGNINDD
jgi:C4-dicarboxylate transporter DctQ subunit